MSAERLGKMRNHDGSTTEPTIWSCDTDQWIPCLDSCQFATTCMRNIRLQAPTLHRRKMSAHALLKMTRNQFRAMSLAQRQKCLRNVVEVKAAMAALF